MYQGSVDGKPANLYRDTGATMTVVNPSHISDEQLLGDVEIVRFANGMVEEIPVARVLIQLNGKQIESEVLVMDCPSDVLLGNNLEHLCASVQTRAQIRQQQDLRKSAEEEQHDLQPKAASIAMNPEMQQAELEPHADSTLYSKMNPNASDWIPIQPSTSGEEIEIEEMRQSDELFKLNPDKLRMEQKQDVSLADVWNKTVPYANIGERSYCFYTKDELFYRKWQPDGRPDLVQHQIVVPKRYRESILKLAHEVPLAGHLGIAKTKAKILRLYYWPNIVKDTT